MKGSFDFCAPFVLGTFDQCLCGHLCVVCWCAEWVEKGTNCLTFAAFAVLGFLSLPLWCREGCDLLTT